MRGLEVYKTGVAPKLLMSGDHGNVDYNEVGTMKQVETSFEKCIIVLRGIFTNHFADKAKEIFRSKVQRKEGENGK
ncbi:MAG: hypothetical protein K6F52_01375 [Clostridia bacterium]|nr:hypothetical protein [Clostridia bacterium]